MTSQDEMVGATHTALIAVLTLEEKVRLLTGRDTWSTCLLYTSDAADE